MIANASLLPSDSSQHRASPLNGRPTRASVRVRVLLSGTSVLPDLFPSVASCSVRWIPVTSTLRRWRSLEYRQGCRFPAPAAHPRLGHGARRVTFEAPHGLVHAWSETETSRSSRTTDTNQHSHSDWTRSGDPHENRSCCPGSTRPCWSPPEVHGSSDERRSQALSRPLARCAKPPAPEWGRTDQSQVWRRGALGEAEVSCPRRTRLEKHRTPGRCGEV